MEDNMLMTSVEEDVDPEHEMMGKGVELESMPGEDADMISKMEVLPGSAMDAANGADTMSDNGTMIMDEMDLMLDDTVEMADEMSHLSTIGMGLADRLKADADEAMTTGEDMSLMPGEGTFANGEKPSINLSGVWRLTLTFDA
jgi:hypothetical protein